MIILAVVALAQFLIALDYSIVYLALPSMARGLDLAPALAPWVVSAYAVLFAGFLVVGGRLTDRFGAARMFVLAIAVFGAASGAGAAAGDAAILLTARGAQGLAAALVQPAVLGLIGTTFPAGPGRSRALAIWSAVGAGGLAAGVLLGGLLTAISWRLTLLVNVPPAAVCAVLVAWWRGRPDGGGDGAGRPGDGRIPVAAAALSTGAVITLVLGLTFGTAQGWGSGPALASLAAAAGLGLWFGRRERAADSPLIGPALRRIGSLRAGAAAAALYMASVGSEFYLVTLLLQTMRHESPVRAGLAFLPLALCVTVGATGTGRLVRRIGVTRTLATGFSLAGAGLGWLAWAAAALQADYPRGLLPGLLVSGVGHGLIYTATFILGTRDVPARQQGTASALLTTAQYLAGAVTLAVLTLVLERVPGWAGFGAAFAVTAGAAIAGGLVAGVAGARGAGRGGSTARAGVIAPAAAASSCGPRDAGCGSATRSGRPGRSSR